MKELTKKDCFAYREKQEYEGCCILNKLYCKKENCKFYKNKNNVDIRQIEYDIRNYLK